MIFSDNGKPLMHHLLAEFIIHPIPNDPVYTFALPACMRTGVGFSWRDTDPFRWKSAMLIGSIRRVFYSIITRQDCEASLANASFTCLFFVSAGCVMLSYVGLVIFYSSVTFDVEFPMGSLPFTCRPQAHAVTLFSWFADSCQLRHNSGHCRTS